MVKNLSKNLIPIAIVVTGILIAGALVFLNQGKVEEPSEIGLLSPQKAAEKALNYINQNILQEGLTASLINVVEENGVYKLRLKIGEQEFTSYVTKDGKLLFTEEGIDLEAESEEKVQKEKSTIGNFSVSKDEICKENGKPIIYLFGSQGCPHCTWEHPIVERIAEDFEGYITFHNNMDSDADRNIFSKYSTGGIPTLVLGCKYYRVGSGERSGEENESEVLTALICKLAENRPSDICDSVQDLISQID